MLLSGEGENVYRRLLEQVVTPVLHLTLSSQWNVREHQCCIALLKRLKLLFPSDLYGYIIANMVMPKLKSAVDAWNPRTDAVPIHSWTQPWQEVVSVDEIQPIYTIVRYKLAAVLQDWHPSDTSAFVVISPWQTAFTSADFDSLIARCILPKLHQVLRVEFVVNPHQQVVDPFNWVMAWVDMIPERVMLQMLRMEFFPKWFQALNTWLSHSPDFEEVSRWYLGWKHLFPDAIKDHPSLKALLNSGLDLMNRALSDPSGLSAMTNQILTELREPNAVIPVTEVPTPKAQPNRTNATGALSFKEIIQQFAQINSIDFVPNARRGAVDGKTIFSFGKVSIYLDNRNIFASVSTQNGGYEWRAVSLQDLLELAR